MGARNQKLIFKKPRKAFRFHYPEGREGFKNVDARIFLGDLNIDSKVGNGEISIVTPWADCQFLLFKIVEVMFFRNMT